MALSVKIDTKDLDKLQKLFKDAGKKTKKELSGVVESVALDTERTMKRLTPVDRGSLRNLGYSKKINDLVFQIGNNADYAAFIEFGTGKRAVIPTELKQFAAQFRGASGDRWDDALQDIKDWCRRKGIDENAAYPILVSILEKGIESQPFLYPAYKLGKKVLVKRIGDYLKNLEIDG